MNILFKIESIDGNKLKINVKCRDYSFFNHLKTLTFIC